MKKILYSIAAIAALFISSCQKEMTSECPVPSKGQTITLKISDGAFNEALVKSSFDGEKISLSKEEPFRICYIPKGGTSIEGSVKATGSEGNYTFTVPEELEVSNYDWYAAGPWNSVTEDETLKDTNLQKIKESSQEMRLFLRVPAVQTPGQNTFDPAADLLLSKSFSVSEGEATIDLFKRISAPLLINIKGLNPGEKIYAASLSVESDNGLSTVMKIRFSDDYSQSGNVYFSDRYNSITAVWQDGLSANGDVWPAWFCVTPTTVEAGSDMTLTVTTQTRTVTRTVPAYATTFVTNKMNRIGFNVCGDGYTEKKTIAQGFMTSDTDAAFNSGGSHTFTASDGKNYAWKTWRAASSLTTSGYAFDGVLPYSLMCSAYSGTFKGVCVPYVDGYKVTGVKAILHPNNFANGKKLQLYPADAVAKGTANPVVESDVVYETAKVESDGTTANLTGLKLCMNGTYNVAMAVLYVEEEEVAVNDYKQIYDNGGDIVIGSRVINKTSNPNSVVVNVAEIDVNTFAADKDGKTVYFVDNSAASSITVTGSYNLYGIIIGRYRNSQPTLETTTTDNYFKVYKKVALKNLNLVIKSSSACFRAYSANAPLDIEDCTIVANGSVLREASKESYYKYAYFNNCVIQVSGPMISSAKAGLPYIGTEDITMINNVVMPIPSEGAITNLDNNIFPMTQGTGTYTSHIVLKNNTFVGFNGDTAGTAHVNLQQIGGFDIEKNIFVGVWPNSNASRIIKTTKKQATHPEPRNVSNNFASYDGVNNLAETNQDSRYYWNNYAKTDEGAQMLDYTNVGNIFKTAGSPFTATDYTNGYFPVNTSVVTNGAGADYSTKSWRVWNAVGGSSESFK